MLHDDDYNIIDDKEGEEEMSFDEAKAIWTREYEKLEFSGSDHAGYAEEEKETSFYEFEETKAIWSREYNNLDLTATSTEESLEIDHFLTSTAADQWCLNTGINNIDSYPLATPAGHATPSNGVESLAEGDIGGVGDIADGVSELAEDFGLDGLSDKADGVSSIK